MDDLEYSFDSASSETYNNSDMHVFCNNLYFYFSLFKRCKVSPFLTEYTKQVYVLVVGESAGYIDNGSSVILFFDQCLWLRYFMEKIIIKLSGLTL